MPTLAFYEKIIALKLTYNELNQLDHSGQVLRLENVDVSDPSDVSNFMQYFSAVTFIYYAHFLAAKH